MIYIDIVKYYKMERYIVDDKILDVLRIHLNDNNDTNLVVAPGFSSDSCRGTAWVFMQPEHIAFLKHKYRNIYIINYSSYKEEQKDACDIRDEKKMRGVTDKSDLYKTEDELNQKIAKIFHKLIIEKLNLKRKIELLGKCAGAGVMLELTAYDDKVYNTLYFAVPGIPFSIERLFSYSKERLSKMKFIFGWVKQDEYPYNWGIKSYDEKERYELLIKKLEKDKGVLINKKLIIDDLKDKEGNSLKNDPKIHHEVSTLLIKEISIIP